MSSVEEYRSTASSLSRREKLVRLINMVQHDPKQRKTALNYALSAQLTKEEEMALLLELVSDDRVLDVVLAYIEKS